METSSIKLEKLKLKLAEKERPYQDLVNKLSLRSVYEESELSSLSATRADKAIDKNNKIKNFKLDLPDNSAKYDSSKDFDDLDSIVSNKSKKDKASKSKENDHKKEIEDLFYDVYYYDDDDDNFKKGKGLGLEKKENILAESNVHEELRLLEKLSRLAELIADVENHYEFIQFFNKEAEKVQKELTELKDANHKARIKEKFEHNIGVLEGMLMLMDDKSSMREATEIQISAYKRMLAWVS